MSSVMLHLPRCVAPPGVRSRREETERQRAGRRIGVDVLAVGFAALDEQILAAAEADRRARVIATVSETTVQ